MIPSSLTAGAAGTLTHAKGRYGLLVDFATSGLPSGVPISVGVSSYTTARGTPNGQTVAFASPGPDPSTKGTLSTQPGTIVEFTYPASVTVGSQTYPLTSVFPASGFTTGAAGTSTHVVATYGSVPPTLTAVASQMARCQTRSGTWPDASCVRKTWSLKSPAGRLMFVPWRTDAAYVARVQSVLHRELGVAALALGADQQ